ncbi:diguanylate cyclase [Vibrio sp. S4M6]|uniref:GGDEF domain-containing protein n=1 Tax=Vibrio sinus TaxID=2946865 RepID=UPI002029EFD8|nr:diguanylate cyclase [Vibrio sinus]MCL9780853.1 diguanylate cyclase [Vibrio sinus]
MTDNDYKKATENLKKAVPLMMKNHVPVTPTNYALWYTYVDNAIPSLNAEMDAAIEKFGICPPATGATLYSSYIANRTEADNNKLKESLEVMLSQASNSMQDTLKGTSQFSKVINENFTNLERANEDGMTIEEIMDVVQELLSESQEIQNSTQFLSDYLQDASKEIGRLKNKLSEMQKDVLFDSLSGLYNRRAFDDDLFTMCHAKQKLSLILLDIDHFKAFNDEYGHLFGDTVIQNIAKRLQASSKEGITSYRFGGEEFAIIVPNKPVSVAKQLAETIRKVIENISIKDKKTGDQIRNITASFGVAELEESDSIEDLVDRADKLLYAAKHAGRNRVFPD